MNSFSPNWWSVTRATWNAPWPQLLPESSQALQAMRALPAVKAAT